MRMTSLTGLAAAAAGLATLGIATTSSAAAAVTTSTPAPHPQISAPARPVVSLLPGQSRRTY